MIDLKKIWKNRKNLHAKSVKLEEKLFQCHKELSSVTEQLKLIEEITDWINGIPVSIIESSSIYGIALLVSRIVLPSETSIGAKVYPNAHTFKNGVAKEFGLEIHMAGYRDRLWMDKDKLLGIHFDYDEARKLAIEWVTKETINNEKVRLI